MSGYDFKKMTPKRDVELGIYEEALDFIFKDANSDVKNIALSGDYSSGKSSIIETYEKNKDKKFIHISLANFEKTKGEIDKELEGKILNQLIQQVGHKSIPKSKFKVKKNIGKTDVFWWTTIVWVILSLFICILNYSTWSEFKNYNQEKYLGVTKSYWAMFIIVCILMGILYYVLYKLIEVQKKENLLRRLNINGNEIELFQNDNDSYFDKYLDEILYILKSAEMDAIIFEDMDRFNSNQIFKRLREINAISNFEKSDRIIRFIYLLRDDVFESKDRTKFFDYLIPIVPVVDSSNSYELLLEYFEKEIEQDGKLKDFLSGVAVYVNDMRIIKNIYNEFLIYNAKVCTVEQNTPKLLGLIIYKNIFPRDFSNLQQNRGYVFNYFEEKKLLLEEKKNRHMKNYAIWMLSLKKKTILKMKKI